MNYKYITYNTIEHLSLHDCVISSARFEGSNLVLDFEHIDILPTHPMNSFNVAKYSGEASLVFENCLLLKSFVYDTSKVKKQEIVAERDAQMVDIDITQLAVDFEVLELRITSDDSLFNTYEFLGNCSLELGSDFGSFVLKSDRVMVCWNELVDDAWFVNFNKRDID